MEKSWMNDSLHSLVCLYHSADVLQVTWQRLYEDNSIENLATYSKRFGEQVNDPYQERIIFTEASLHSTSITVRNLTWADESCYVCSFNAYPEGSKRHQTCLKVQGRITTLLFRFWWLSIISSYFLQECPKSKLRCMRPLMTLRTKTGK